MNKHVQIFIRLGWFFIVFVLLYHALIKTSELKLANAALVITTTWCMCQIINEGFIALGALFLETSRLMTDFIKRKQENE